MKDTALTKSGMAGFLLVLFLSRFLSDRGDLPDCDIIRIRKSERQ